MALTTMANYSEIQTGEQLKAAIEALRLDAAAQRKALERDYSSIRSALKPVAGVGDLYGKSRRIVNWVTLALALLSRFRRRR